MATITIQLDGSVSGAGTPSASRDDFLAGETITVTDPANVGGSPLTTLIGKPPGSAAAISGATSGAATFVVDIPGTYLVRHQNGTEDSGTVDDAGQFITSQGGAAVKFASGHLWRLPAPVETKQFDSTHGWNETMDPILRDIQAYLPSADQKTDLGTLDGAAVGTVWYANASGRVTQLAPGTVGYVLQTNGAAAPSWVDPSSFGGAHSMQAAYDGGPAVTLTTANPFALTLPASTTAIDDALTVSQTGPTYWTSGSSPRAGVLVENDRAVSSGDQERASPSLMQRTYVYDGASSRQSTWAWTAVSEFTQSSYRLYRQSLPTTNWQPQAIFEYDYSTGEEVLSLYVGELRGPTGDAASPGYTFNTDADTGVFHPATNTLGLSAGGTEIARFDADNVWIGGTSGSARLNVIADGTTVGIGVRNSSNANKRVVRLRAVSNMGTIEALDSNEGVRGVLTCDANGGILDLNSAGTTSVLLQAGTSPRATLQTDGIGATFAEALLARNTAAASGGTPLQLSGSLVMQGALWESGASVSETNRASITLAGTPNNTTAQDVTRAFQYDASLTSFSDITSAVNSATTADVNPWPASEEVGDALYLGFPSRFSALSLIYNGGTAGVGGTVSYSYWAGEDGWQTVDNLSDGSNGFTAAAGTYTARWTPSQRWRRAMFDPTLVQPPLFWLRIAVASVYSTNPVLDRIRIAATASEALVSIDHNPRALGYPASGVYTHLAEGGELRTRGVVIEDNSLYKALVPGLTLRNTTEAGSGSGVNTQVSPALEFQAELYDGAESDTVKMAWVLGGIAGSSPATPVLSLHSDYDGAGYDLANPVLQIDDSGKLTVNDLVVNHAVALGGGSSATLGTIGGSGPATAGQNEWLQIETDSGTRWVPCWA